MRLVGDAVEQRLAQRRVGEHLSSFGKRQIGRDDGRRALASFIDSGCRRTFVRYETTPDQLRYLLAGLRRILIAHPRVDDGPLRVRFAAFGAYSLDIKVFSYIDTTDPI